MAILRLGQKVGRGRAIAARSKHSINDLDAILRPIMALQVKRTKQQRTFPPPKAAAAACGRRTLILEKAVAAEKAEKKKQAAAERRRLKAVAKKHAEKVTARKARLKATVLPLIVARDGVSELGRAIGRAAQKLQRKIRQGAGKARDNTARAAGALLRRLDPRPALRFLASIPLTIFGLIGLMILAVMSVFRMALGWLPILNPLPHIHRAALYAAAFLKRRFARSVAVASRLAAWTRDRLNFLQPRRLVTYSYAAAVGVSLVIVGGQIALQIATDARDREATEELASYQVLNNAPVETESAVAILAEDILPTIAQPTEKTAVATQPPPRETKESETTANLSKAQEPARNAALSPAAKPALEPMPDLYPLTPSRPVIAVVIDDMGMVKGELKRFARLPKEVTFAFLPYAPDLESQTRLMRDNGHELIVHMPMEPKRRTADPGPQALLTGLADADLVERIAWNLERFEGFSGINNHMGSRFTEDRQVMRAVMSALKERNLYFLDSMTTPDSVGISTAAEVGVPRAQRDIFLDNERDYDAIMGQLKKAERIARRRGHVIAIGHPYRITYHVLKDWAAGLEDKNIQLVPLSALISYPLPDIKIAENSEVTPKLDQAGVTAPSVTVASSGAAGLR